MANRIQRLQSLLDSASDLYQSVSPSGELLYVNSTWCETLGYPLDVAMKGVSFFELVHPQERDRTLQVFHAVQIDDRECDLKTTLVAKDGRAIPVYGRVSYSLDSDGLPAIWSLWRIEGAALPCFPQTTRLSADESRSNSFLDAQNHILEQIAKGTSLRDVLHRLAQLIEHQANGMLCSLYLMDQDGVTLHRSAAPSLPESYKQAIDRIQIGPHAWSWGAAAYYQKRVITPNIAIDPDWAEYCDLALSHGLRACWSSPIFSAQGAVLGTFVLYYRQPCTPSAEDLYLIERSTYLASIAIERQQAEAALQESEERLRIALSASRMGVWDCNLKTGKVTWSDNLEHLYGLTPGEFNGSDAAFLSLVHPADRNLVFQASRQAIRQRTNYDIEFRVIRPDQEVRWIASKGQVIYEETGRPIRMTGINLDITDRKILEESLRKANEEQGVELEAFSTELTDTIDRLQQEIIRRQHIEAALRESEERYRSVVAAMQEGIMLHDAEGYIYACNVSAERILGLSTEQILGRTSLDLCWHTVYEDGTPFNGRTHPAVVTLQTGKPCSDVVMGVYKPSGTLTWISINSQPLFRHGETHPYSVVISFADITARKQAETALRNSEALYRAIVEDQTELVCRFLPDGSLTFVNEAYCQVVGIPRETLLGYNYKMFLLVLDKETAVPLTASLQASSSVSWLEHQVILPSGEVRWHQWNSRAIFDDAGHFIEFQAVGRDITDRKRAEEEILRALVKEKELNELKSRFVSMISHEFRTPLTTIQSASELLEYYEWSAEQKRERFQQIHAAVQQMTQLLEDVLLIGRADSGKLYSKSELLDLAVFCRDLITDLQLMRVSERNFKFVIQGESQKIWIDPKLVRQIVNNLLSNAIKYSPDGSNIELELVFQPEQINLKVQDEGIGIPPEDRERLFEAFYRATNVDTIQGTGLGLAIVKKCVDLYQGQITFESTVGVGTTFTITLPISHPPQEESDAKNSSY